MLQRRCKFVHLYNVWIHKYFLIFYLFHLFISFFHNVQGICHSQLITDALATGQLLLHTLASKKEKASGIFPEAYLLSAILL